MSNRPFQTTRDFADALDTFGADLQAWPNDLRQEGDAMLRRSPEAQRLLREARVVHRVLSERLTVSTDSHLVNAILERKGAHDREEKRLLAGEAAKNVATVRQAMINKGLAAALLIGGGVVAGSLTPQMRVEAAAQPMTMSDISSYTEYFYF